MATFVPTLLKVNSEVGDLLASATGQFAFWELTGAQPATDSLAFNVEFIADRLLGIAFRM